MGHFKNNLTGTKNFSNTRCSFIFFSRPTCSRSLRPGTCRYDFCFKVWPSSTFGRPQFEAGHAAGTGHAPQRLTKQTTPTTQCHSSMLLLHLHTFNTGRLLGLQCIALKFNNSQLINLFTAYLDIFLLYSTKRTIFFTRFLVHKHTLINKK